MTDAILVFEDGRAFYGEAFGAVGETFGEAVFTTGMTGYQETLTDPSYHRQVVVQTAPHIGNTGVNDEDDESSRIWVAGYVVRDPARLASNWRATGDLEQRLKAEGVVGIAGIDTRALTRHLRERGAMRVGVSSVDTDPEALRRKVLEQPEMTGAVLGTASYIAPEQASGSPATGLSDVYSLGIVAYQCLSGHRPFEGDTPLEIAMKHVTGTARPLPEDVPQPIRQVVERAMSKEPSVRWGSADAFAVAARHAASGAVPAQRPVVSVGRPGVTPFKPGAAAVGPPVPPTVNLAYRPQSAAAQTGGGGRATLIVVWVVLAVLTLVVCSYLGYAARRSQNKSGGTPPTQVLSVADSRPEMMFQMTEGRLTR